MGILNSLKHFSTPAASPILLNVGIILGALIFSRYTSEPSLGLAYGVLIGGLFQILLQVPPLIKLGFLPKISWDPHHPGVKKILGLMLPSIYGSAVYQLNILAITFMASFLVTGSVSWLWYADRVMEFPLGVFAISFATVILPQLSDHAADKNMSKLKKTFREGLQMIYFVNFPATVGLIVLAEMIVSVLFQHGNFSSHSTQMTPGLHFALGLPLVSGTVSLPRPFCL
jgi:putative peptidoglycan lipid II flippase